MLCACTILEKRHTNTFTYAIKQWVVFWVDTKMAMEGMHYTANDHDMLMCKLCMTSLIVE